MSLLSPDPETIALLQSFGYGMAQNLISSAIVEWKKLKDDKNAQENTAWLENVEHSKSLEGRVVQAVCEALRNLALTKEQLQLLLPLASDPVFGSELAREILADKYSPQDLARIILQCSPSAESLSGGVIGLASLLVTAIQSAIADDPHLHRTKELQFQVNIIAQVAEVKAETSKTQDTVRETGVIRQNQRARNT